MIVDGQPTFRCLACHDTGLANVWNPKFIEEYRIRFSDVTRKEAPRIPEGPRTIGSLKRITFNLNKYDPKGEVTAWLCDPPNWEYLAARWWRKETEGQGGSVHHVALCNCECERKLRLENELYLFLNDKREIRNTRTGKMDKMGLPACGRAKYNPKVMPLKTRDSFADLTNWYATHAFNEVHEWQP